MAIFNKMFQVVSLGVNIPKLVIVPVVIHSALIHVMFDISHYTAVIPPLPAYIQLQHTLGFKYCHTIKLHIELNCMAVILLDGGIGSKISI